nr:ribonuclease H-like domain-containing protein [Tanacetum cinerariifolium]
MELETTQTSTTAKLPMLKQGDYEMWRLRTEQYFQEDLNLKFLRSLPSEWNTHVVVWRNKPDLTTSRLLNKRGIRNQDSRNKYQDGSRRTVNVEKPLPRLWLLLMELVLTRSIWLKMSYGPISCEKESKNASEDIPNELKEYPDAPLVKDTMSDNKDCSVESLIMVEKKTNVPTIAKFVFFRPKQQQKLVRKPVKPRAVNTVRPRTVNTARLRAVNTARRNSAVVNAVRANQGHPQKVQEDQGYVDSGCSRHMTGNLSYLSNFKEFDGGYVTFRGGANGGKITGKGTLKTS